MFDSVREVKFSTIILVAVMVGTVMVVTWWMLVPESLEVPTAAQGATSTVDVPGSNAESDSAGEASGESWEPLTDEATPSESGTRLAVPVGQRSGTESVSRSTSTAPTVPERGADSEAPQSVSGRFTVQVGSFGQEAGALRRQEELRAEGYRLFIEEVEANGKKVFRLYLGRFGSRDEANRAAELLKARGIDCFVKEIN